MIALFCKCLIISKDAAPPLDGQWLSSTGNLSTMGGTAAIALGQATTQFGSGDFLGTTGQLIKTGGLIAAPIGLLMSYGGNKMMIGDLKQRYLEVDESAMGWAAGLSILAVGTSGTAYYFQNTGETEEWHDWLMWTSLAASAGAGLALYTQDKRSNTVYRAGVYHEEYGALPKNLITLVHALPQLETDSAYWGLFSHTHGDGNGG